MNFKRLMTGALALAATGLLVTACSSKQKANSTGQVASKQVLDWSYLAELATLDPSKVSMPIVVISLITRWKVYIV